ncbi:MAG: hypothetical protein QOJ16_3808 [Acidobacteriota bacterium]|nr:hypothetical protein [Acidobacteriota bacterium]
MRILLLQSSAYIPSLGGANKANRLLLERLAARGHDCRVVGTAGGERAVSLERCLADLAAAGVSGAATGGDPGAVEFRHAGVTVEAVLDGARLRACAASRLRGPAERVLVSSEDPAQILLEEALAAVPGRVVYIAHTTLHLPFGPDGFLASPGRTELLRKAAGIIAVSDYVREYLARHAGLAAAVLRFPVYGDGPFPVFDNFETGAVALINPCTVKGIGIFLELARRCPDLPFAAVPTWGTTAADRAALAELPNVLILEPEADVDRIFARCRILLVPSLWGEAFGQVAVEAMLRGVPVLASDSGGLAEATLGVGGVLPIRPIRRYEERFDERKIPIAVVPEQDPGPWEEALRELLGDRERYHARARESRRAALAFVSGLGVEPFELYLAELPQGVSAVPAAPVEGIGSGRSRLDGLSPAKLALLARRLQKKNEAVGETQEIPRLPRSGAPEGDLFPLSFAQERLWFLDRLEPGSWYYAERFPVRLTGRLDVRLLAAALDRIARRHEVLRTTYSERDGAPVQVVPRAGTVDPLTLPLIDLRRLPEAAGRAEADRLANAWSRRPFNLQRGPVLRVALVHREASEHLLLLAVHHIAADNWSASVVFAELGALYRALASGVAPVLPALPVQYADFAVWQRGYLTGERNFRESEHWRQALAGAPALLALPTDRPRPAWQGHHGERVEMVLPLSLAEGLRTLARRREATPFMLLLAAFQALLHRCTGENDLVVGVPVAGRDRKELEPLVGFFLNLLPMRARIPAGLPFAALLDQARRGALDAFAHQDLPFERLVEALAPERSLGHSPLFQVLFNFLNVPSRQEELPGVTMRAFPVAEVTVRYDLELYTEDRDQRLSAVLAYDDALFDAATAARLLRCFVTLLAGVVERPEEAVSALPLLGPAELHQLGCEWNDTAAALPMSTVPALFAAQAARTPEAPAVAQGESCLTYFELGRQTDHLARRLAELGVGPEVLVGISLRRSPSLVVALLGVLAAGGTYLPLDPTYPLERLSVMLEDARPRVLITDAALAAGLFAGLPVLPEHLVLLDARDAEREGEPWRPRLPAEGANLAYVLFTSGSTGRPKGVEVTHTALANFLAAMAIAPGLPPGGRLLAVTSLSFDIAALEIFLPLLSGGAVELAREEEAADGAWLARRLSGGTGAPRVSALQATPATWRLLLDAGWAGEPSLTALCGGEALPRSLATALALRTGELWNLYGPTETTVWSSLFRLEPWENGPVSIGRPIANTRILLLDGELRPVPPGVVGELYIGGAGLARGYRGHPERTAERFVPEPIGDGAEPGARLYRTGDLARHLAGGRGLEVLGRIDHQVKVRGFRIEMGEVEAALSVHPAVRQAVVVTRRDPAGGDRLVAYVVLSGTAGRGADAGVLRDFLAGRLPGPFVPAAFVVLDRLPLTANGKIDRRALPTPEPAAAEGKRRPATPAEELVAGIWEEVLGIEAVGRDDSFFELGGHSLLATQVLSRVRRSLAVELPVRALFEAPTVAALAARVEAARGIGASGRAPLPPIPRAERGRPLPLSPGQRRLWFLDQLEPGSAAYNVPVLVRLDGPLDEAALWRSLARLVARHEVLRTRFEAASGEPVQVIAATGAWPPCRVEFQELPAGERELERLVRREASRPFDLARGPLYRGILVGLAAERHALLLVLHHIVCDGWSMGVILDELTALYSASAAGEPSPLPDLAVQYADFAAWQHSSLREEREGELAFWREQLAGAPALLALPTDRPRPVVQSLRGRQVAVRLPAVRQDGLQAVSRRHGVTRFMLLLAAFQVLLSRWSGEPGVLVGTPVANRTRPEIEGLIGFFVNTLVVRGDLREAEPFAGFLARVRATALAAYAHQELPFEELVAELAPERSLGHSPLFQVLLALHEAPIAACELGRLRLSPVPIASGTAKFDLYLALGAQGSGLAGTLEYATDLFDQTTVERFLGHLETLLAAVSEPGEPGARAVGELPLLAVGERRQLTAEWNDRAPATAAAESPVHLRVERQAGRTPRAVAVRSGEVTLRYGELNTQANRLARQLRAAGVSPEARVGILAERSPLMLVAILATLKAGGAYVPLDPTYPPERLAFMLEDAGTKVLLTDLPRAALPPWADGLPVLAIEATKERDEEGEEDGESNPESGASGENLAYVLYTSGSTGRPKGVAMPHRVLANLLAWQRGVLPAAGARTLQFAHLGFDVSFQEIFSTLGEGGELVIADDAARREPDRLLRLLADERIERLFVPPVALLQLAEVAAGGPPLVLRDVITAGEQLRVTPALVRWFQELPGCTLHNHYGPTEGHVVSFFRLTGPPAEWPELPPIGRPLDGVRLYLLDRQLRVVPAVIAGELYLGGAVPARGYLGRPGLTAERFVPDAVSGVPGTRLYRTGDLARFHADGVVQFLGRADDQVKVRGFRIEPGEIESVLTAYPGVAEAAVLAREDRRPGDRRLVAYIVANPVPDARELRSFHAARLP